MASPSISKTPSKQGGKPKPAFVDRFKGNKVFFAIAIAVALAIAGLVLFILSSVVATTKYYVLNTEVPARSQITQSMLTEVVTSKGGEPRNALSLAEVMSQETYAKFALNTGDILTESNTGDRSPLTAGLPDDFTVMSITVQPQNAVAGKIAAGDYIDIVASDGDARIAKVVMRHILVTDAMTDPSQVSAQGTTAAEDAEGDANAAAGAAPSTEDALRQGVPQMYTVAVSLEDAAKLQLLMGEQSFSVLLSPEGNSDGVKEESISSSMGEIFGDEPIGDSGEGTDPTFGQGAPVEEQPQN